VSARCRGTAVAPRHEAIKAGEQILAAGGNAVDSVIGMSLVEAVCEPYMTGPGGVGEAVYLTSDNRCVVMDAIGLAPLRATAEMFEIDERLDLHPRGWPRVRDDENTFGIRAVTTPRLLSGLNKLHDQFGRLTWSAIVEPALEEARRGALVDYFSAAKLVVSMRTLAQDPFASALYYPNGYPIPPPITDGPVKVMNEPLIASFEAIRSDGAKVISEGFVGRAIASRSRVLGGVLDDVDLRRESTIETDVKPLGSYLGWEIYGSPHPSGAPTVTMILALLERTELKGAEVNSASKYRAVIRACMLAMRERWHALAGDTDEATVRVMLEEQHLEELMQMELNYAAASLGAMPSSSTTHCCACDADGGACAMTTTLVTSFGAQIAVPECGVFLNNGMQWFDPRPGYPASIAPGKRGMTAMSPLILRHPASERLLIMSGIGGLPIMTGVAQAAHDVVCYDVPIVDAVDRPRVHAQVTSRGALVGIDERLGAAATDALTLDGLPVPEAWHYGPTSMNGCRIVGIDYDRGSGALISGIDQRSRASWSFGRQPEYEVRI
jgi:gamma-glutamyltranspeptidase/glutathione hydrolase